MTDLLLKAAEGPVTPIHPLRPDNLEAFMGKRRDALAAQVQREGFKAKAGQILVVPRPDGALERVLFGLGDRDPDAMAFRALSAKLPSGQYRLVAPPRSCPPDQIALAWALGSYAFDRYRPRHERQTPRLVAGEGVDIAEVVRVAHACALLRDMVNTPANDMGPLQIETIAREMAEQYGAEISVIAGDDLHEANYPAVHAVGRAADPARAPRMIELTWGSETAPRIALVGKGVVFDTGGLDIKSTAGMRLMKKDMGGAAHALALGRMIMGAELKVRLSILVPAVENAISGDAMRPGDIIGSRKGLSIEVGNTDAEGRLILADALARAAELEPELTFDFATLTGAARVALGPQLPPFFTDDDRLAADIEKAARKVSDPMWRLPLWAGYDDAVDGDISDLRNDPEGWAQAGAITAALFLRRFAPAAGWVHFDVFAWNSRSRAGWPTGGEAQAIRAVYRLLRDRYS